MEVKPAKRNKLTLYIGIALVAGIIAGFILNKYYVGIENTKIANAEVQSKNLHQRIKGYETVKDSTAFTSLSSLQKKILQHKKQAEIDLLKSDDEVNSFSRIKLLTDSRKKSTGS